MICMCYTDQPPTSSHQEAINEGEKTYLDGRRGRDILNVNGSSQWRGKGTKNNE